MLEDVNIWRNMYRVVLCGKKMYRVVGVYVLFVIIINEVHSGAMVVTKDVSGRSNCYVSVNNLVWCLF